MLKYFKIVLRKYKNAKEIWDNLFKNCENLKTFETTLQKYLENF